MNAILGVSCYYHDSAAALICAGNLVAASTEERFSLKKHDAAYPRQAIDFVLRHASMTSDQLDSVIFYERPHVALSRALCLMLNGLPGNLAEVGRHLQSWFGKKLWIRTQLAAHLEIAPSKIAFCPHHLAHASHAFLCSPHTSAAVMTLDGVGEWSSGALYRARRGEPMELLRELQLDESLGLLYAAVTRRLGLKPNADECSTMALAAFHDVTEPLRQLDPASLDLSFDDERIFRNLFRDHAVPHAVAATRTLDARASQAGPLAGPVRTDVRLAATAQATLEARVHELAQQLHRATGEQVLCLGGGVANNSVLVTKLVDMGLFKHVYVPLDPGDAGAAVGAAAWKASQLGQTRLGISTPYLGHAIPATLAPETVRLYDKVADQSAMPVKIVEHADLPATIDFCVRQLCNGRVLAWAQGRAEFGPRALGNRSILVLPGRVDLADRVATAIKQRQRFRPFALSILEEDAERILSLSAGLDGPLRWMQAIARVRDGAVPLVRAAMHTDGTTRPQIVGPGDGTTLYELLQAVKRSTGLGALLNTSMNVAGMPLVNDEVDALLFFKMAPVDVLACANLSLSRS